MAYKYKLKEIEVGDVKIDGGVKSVVTDKDPNTGAISWSIDYVPNLTKLVEDSMELANTAKGVYQKAKDDKKFLDIYEQAKQLRNTIRTHVRNNYPEDYKKAIFEEDVDEISMSGAAGAYNTPYAFKKIKKKKVSEGIGASLGPGPKATEDGVKDNAYVKQFKYKLVPKNKNGNYVQKGSGLEVKNF
tara:strand:- start:217 stop:777 length:561 start_codon:yes stop_codon:yes gene_type:complete